MSYLEDKQRYLITNRTRSELLFAEMLRAAGVQFKEQEIILGYIPDFYFPGHDHRIVELDGRCHDIRKKQDAKRDAKLKAAGFVVMRVHSQDVFTNAEWLMHRVLMFLKVPHAKVSRTVRLRRRRARKPKKKNSPAWTKVPKLTKDHLPK